MLSSQGCNPGVCPDRAKGRAREELEIDPSWERVVEMAQCEVCGNEYDKAFSTPDTHAPPTLTVSLAG